ncbi:PIN domain-containing protein [Achromobacter aloeverae]|uniref:PIN domain-containing protein n=1 Tax=Achromobacter aloeverae TaxID=1750518 RepID=A0A4V1MS47_9BURK|nr:PIN domain-containing protein [Achromobacter aloeverae]RXN88220.1 PIN domain-containing protein [Achromobacter aloeverae]
MAAGSPPLLVLDACVLMSSVLRPLLLQLAGRDAYRPVWSARIGQEWVRNAARIWEVDRALVEQDWQAMQARFPDADAGEFDAYESGLRYSDPKDRHVIAAGLARRARCGEQIAPATGVLTWNLKDFNRSELRRLGMDVYSPDRLLSFWWEQDPEPLRDALALTMEQLVATGRQPEPLAVTLNRERLHRLRGLMMAAQAA